MKKVLVAFLVTWDVSGFSMFQCNDPKGMDPVVGLCVSPVNMNRSASFTSKAEAEKVEKALAANKATAYKVTNVHMYEESKGK